MPEKKNWKLEGVWHPEVSEWARERASEWVSEGERESKTSKTSVCEQWDVLKGLEEGERARAWARKKKKALMNKLLLFHKQN